MCKVCLSSDSPEGNELLLCDGEGCTSCFHLGCLDPPLREVLGGDWSVPVSTMRLLLPCLYYLLCTTLHTTLHRYPTETGCAPSASRETCSHACSPWTGSPLGLGQSTRRT